MRMCMTNLPFCYSISKYEEVIGYRQPDATATDYISEVLNTSMILCSLRGGVILGTTLTVLAP